MASCDDSKESQERGASQNGTNPCIESRALGLWFGSLQTVRQRWEIVLTRRLKRLKSWRMRANMCQPPEAELGAFGSE